MNRMQIGVLLAGLAMCLTASAATTESHANPPAAAASAAGAPLKTPGKTAKVKARSKVKPVDINGASKAALIGLPGITDVEADKIIAGRPYGSKTWLITNQVLDRKTYEGIKGLVEAKQPFKTAEQNAAVYNDLKKQKGGKL